MSDLTISVVSPPVISVKAESPPVISINVEPPKVISINAEPPPVIAITVEPKPAATIELTSFQGPSGPVGPTGPRGADGAVTISKTSSANLSGHRAVIIDGLGGVVYADCANPSHTNRVVGITTSASLIGAESVILPFGEIIEPSWIWNLNLPVYLGLEGFLTQIPPTAPTSFFSLVIGFPIATTRLFVNIGNPINLTV